MTHPATITFAVVCDGHHCHCHHIICSVEWKIVLKVDVLKDVTYMAISQNANSAKTLTYKISVQNLQVLFNMKVVLSQGTTARCGALVQKACT